MTTQEFSNAFDTLLNSHRDIKDFGQTHSGYSIELDEYEKSILLTQAQDIVVKSYFDRTLNPQAQGFDDSARRQIDFSELIKVAELSEVNGDDEPDFKYDDRSKLYKMPTESMDGVERFSVLFILNEKFIVNRTPSGGAKTQRSFIVVPINYLEYDRLMSKPFGQPLKKQAWRLFQNKSGLDLISEIIPVSGVTNLESGVTKEFKYKIRYVKRPRPIILANLASGEYSGGLEIDGYSKITECELNPIIHMDILIKAVELALSRIGSGGGSQKDN